MAGRTVVLAPGVWSDYERIPGDKKARRYRNTQTGKIISRRKFDETFRLPHQGFETYERKARAHRAAGFPEAPARGRRGVAGRRRVDPFAEVHARRLNRRSRVQWWVRTFNGHDLPAALFFIRANLRARMPEGVVLVRGYGTLSIGGTGGIDEEEEMVGEDAQGRPLIAHVNKGWASIVGLTRVDSFDAARAQLTLDHAEQRFIALDQIEVMWRERLP